MSMYKTHILDRVSYPISRVLVLLKDMRLGALGASLTPCTGTTSKECNTCSTAPRIERKCFINPLCHKDRNTFGRIEEKEEKRR